MAAGGRGAAWRGDDLGERREFKQHKQSSMLLRKELGLAAPQAPLDFYSPVSLSVSALQLNHHPAPNRHSHATGGSSSSGARRSWVFKIIIIIFFLL